MTLKYLGDAIYKTNVADERPPTAISGAMLIETDTRKTFIYDGVDWNLSAGGTGGGGGAGGALLNKGGIFITNGTASQTVFNIEHEMGLIPDSVTVEPASIDALGDYVVTKDATNIIITFQEPPPSGFNNVKFEWGAGLAGIEGALGTTPTGHTKVYKIGTTYYAENYANTIISSSGTLETVLQAAINQTGNVYMTQDGNFDFSNANIGVTFTPANNHTNLILGANTKLRPHDSLTNTSPNAGLINFLVTNTSTANIENIHIYGGIIEKPTLPGNRLWWGIRYASTDTRPWPDTKGIVWCGVHGTRIITPFGGLRFDINGNGWMNTCQFDNIVVDGPVYGYDFADVSTGTPGTYGFNRNVFNNCDVQPAASAPVTRGFSEVALADITFRNCNVWDLHDPATQKTMTIKSTAKDIFIKGGIVAMPGLLLNNATSRTVHIEPDEWNVGSSGGITILDSIFLPNGRQTGRYNVTTNYEGTGLLKGTGTAGVRGTDTGIIKALNNVPTAVAISYPSGLVGRRHATAGGTAALRAGILCDRHITFRGWDPIFKIRFRVNQTGNQRWYIGWTNFIANDTTSDAAVGVGYGGVMLYCRAADTNWQIGHSDGSTAITTVATGVPIFPGGIATTRTFELIADNANSRFRWSLDGSAWGDLTTNIPAAGYALSPICQCEASDTVAKSIDIFGLYVESK